jgi:predicted TIM-barrel fold metal-dependent hydrolase
MKILPLKGSSLSFISVNVLVYQALKVITKSFILNEFNLEVSTKMVSRLLVTLLFLVFSTSHASQQRTLFDSHLHYGGEDVAAFTSQQVLDIFDRNHVRYALISSTPNDGTEKIYHAAPERIIPFLGLYKTLRDKRDWMHDHTLPNRLKEDLKKGFYRGLGELHIFAKDKKSPVLKEVVLLAKQNQLYLQIHSDAEVIDEVFSIDPDATVLWAHMGTTPQPDFLRAVLERHPNGLYIDTSVRDKQLLENGQLSEEWKKLFIDYQDRFMVAVDTFSVNRWNTFDLVIKDINDWLDDLPGPVAEKLAFQNAYKLFFKQD